MKIYFAPMEGITNFDLRSIHNRMFGGCDKYFTPFISTNDSYKLNQREKKDISPEENEGLTLVPQIISNSAEQSAGYIRLIHERYGYKEVNINMGCPSGTVVSKNKGSGLLRDIDFFEDYMAELSDSLLLMKAEGVSLPDISLKTRIGFYSEGECGKITEILVRYPVNEVIVHPRFGKQMYEGKTHLEEFSDMYDALKSKGIKVSYNGDINTPEDYEKITGQFPELEAVMIGRGLLKDPSLARRIKGGDKASSEEYLKYMETLLDAYAERIPSEKHLLSKMKDLWNFTKPAFSGNEKGFKEMSKAGSLETYRVCIKQYIKNAELTI